MRKVLGKRGMAGVRGVPVERDSARDARNVRRSRGTKDVRNERRFRVVEDVRK